MGVLNVTPDSFSDGGEFFDVDLAVEHARTMIREGADIIDVGGESSRPGAEPISVDEELRRVIPVIQRLKDVTLSIDTIKAEVAEKALAAGARVVNDISALRTDPRMTEVVRERRAGVVLMHMQGTPQTMQREPHYADVVSEVRRLLRERVDAAVAAGIDPAAIAIDPGIGFGKNLEHNLKLLAHLDELREVGPPVMVGVSRKSFIGKVLGRETHERVWGTAACVAWAVAHGANIVRVHDVAEMKEVAQMIEAIKRA
jgi:dihydropteroate synthase